MKTWQTKEEILAEAWFGGQVERVVALLAELHAEADLVAALQTELNEAREDASSWERVATEQQDRAMRAEKHRDATIPGEGPYTADDVTAIETLRGKPYARLRATVTERDAALARVADLEASLSGFDAISRAHEERDASRARVAELEASRDAELMVVAERVYLEALSEYLPNGLREADRTHLAALVKGGGR